MVSGSVAGLFAQTERCSTVNSTGICDFPDRIPEIFCPQHGQIRPYKARVGGVRYRSYSTPAEGIGIFDTRLPGA